MVVLDQVNQVLNQVYETNLYQSTSQFVSQNILALPKEFWGCLGLAIATICLLLYFWPHWKEAQPNEWLLVIRNGKLVKAGVGMKTWVWSLESTVTIPSKVYRVHFKASNVTK